MKYRICSLILAMLAASGACMSCTESSTDTPDAGVTTAAGTDSAAETEALPPEYVKPDADYAGESFTLAAVEYEQVGPEDWLAGNYCEVYEEEENGDPLNDAIYQRNQMVNDVLNVKLDYYPFKSLSTAATELRKFAMAGEDVIDIALVGAAFLPQILGSGVLVDWKTIPKVDFSHTWWDQNSVEELTILDTQYAVTGNISLYINYAPITYFFSKKLVSELTLEDPYALVDSGKWTLPKAMEMSRAAAADLNGDGNVDVSDRFGMLCEPTTLGYTVLSSGCRYTKKNADNVPELAVDLERASKVVEEFGGFMADKNVNILSSNYSGKYNNVFTDLMLPMFKENRALFYNNQLLVALNLRSMDADFGILPPPKLDEAQENYCCPINDWWGTFAVLPTTNTKYEMTGDVAEALGYYSQQIVTPAYVDTTVRGKALRDNESSRMVELILSNRVYDTASFYDWGGIKSMFASMIAQDSAKFMSKYASVEKNAKKKIAKTIEEIEANAGN